MQVTLLMEQNSKLTEQIIAEEAGPLSSKAVRSESESEVFSGYFRSLIGVKLP